MTVDKLKQTFSTNYHVLDTDYTSYSIVYSCYDGWFGGKHEDVWILGRYNSMSDTQLQTLRNWMKAQPVLAHYDFSKDAVLTDHSNCAYP